jgi:hypothetical protein
MRTYIATAEQISNHWHDYRPLLEEALSHGCGETKLTEYLRRLMGLQAQLWIVEDAGALKGVCLTQFLDYSTHKTLHIVACSGVDFTQWAHLHAGIESFAIKAGAVAVEQWGRPGWARVLPKLIPGYRPVYQVMRKDLPIGVTRT